MSDTKHPSPTKELERMSDAEQQDVAAIATSLVTRGDISGLSAEDMARFYVRLCTRLRLDPTTQPLARLRLNGKEILYATRGATDQLASVWGINRDLLEHPSVVDTGAGKIIRAVCRATWRGRTDTATGAVPVPTGGGEALCNALLKAESKAKRRATLSILGLGLLDETEVESIPARERVEVPLPAVVTRGPAASDEARPSAAPTAPAPPSPRQHPAFRAFVDALEKAESTDGVVASWRTHAQAVLAAGEDVARECRRERLCAWQHHGGVGEDDLRDAIERASAARKAKKGTAKPNGEPPPIKRPAEPSASLAVTVPAPMRLDELREHLLTKHAPFEVAAGYHKRSGAWRTAGTLAEARAITIDRLLALGIGGADDTASAWLDAQEPSRRAVRRASAAVRGPST